MPLKDTLKLFVRNMVGGAEEIHTPNGIERHYGSGEERKVLAVAEGLAMLTPAIFGRNELAQLTCIVGLVSTFGHAVVVGLQTFDARD